MLTRLVIIVLVMLAAFRGNAASLKGLILAYEVGGQPMANVPVAADGANSTVTNAMGEFTFEFPGKHPGDTVYVRVEREGWVVVNDVQLQLALPVDPDAKPLTVILCPEAERERWASLFYRLTSDKAIESAYQQKLKALEDTQQATSAALTKLQQERDQAKAAAQKASEELAKGGPVQSAELYQKAKRLYLEGKSEEALIVLFKSEASVELSPSPATPSASEDYEHQSIEIAKTLWENLRGFMRWDVFPKDYKSFLEAFVVNGAVVGVIYFLFVLALYGISPANFAGLHEWIANRGIPFSENVSKILAPFLLDTPYCLNAVVRRYRQRARQLFDKAPEVKTRPKWVPAPLLLGDELLQDYDLPPAKLGEKPYVAGLQEIKARLGKGDERWTISIEGPGGVGKSALAFEIARWASDSRSDYRLAPFPMLPILLESLERSTDKAKTIDAAAAAQLQSVMNAVKISDPLLQALLSRKRVLVVVDGISEMPAWVGQGAIGPDSGAVNARALVMTSRLPTNLPESLVIRPQGLTLAILDRVLDGLIAANVGSGRFNDGEREELRQHLRSLLEDARDGVKERQVPMIFLKLMIERGDQLLKEKKQLDELPRELSELVTDYTERQLLRNEPDIHLAMQLARTTAQVCMGKERSPAARSENRYKSKGVSKEVLDKFVTAGLMVRSGEKGDPFYKFALDPIAEQLDANRLVIDIREDQVDRTELDDLTQRWEELPEDFVRAFRRAAARYREEICRSQRSLSLKLWPEEIKATGLNGIGTVDQVTQTTSARDVTTLEQEHTQLPRFFMATTPLPVPAIDMLLWREKPEKEGGELKENQVIMALVEPLELGYEAAKQVRTNLDNNISYWYFFQGNFDVAERIPQLLHCVLIAPFLDKSNAASFKARRDLVTNHQNEILEALKDICSSGTLNIFFLNDRPDPQYCIHNATSDKAARLYLKRGDEFIEWESGRPAYEFWWAMRRKSGVEDPQFPDAVFHETRDFELKDGPFLKSLKMSMRKCFGDIADEVMELCLKGPR